jgi:hypothetical protein
MMYDRGFGVLSRHRAVTRFHDPRVGSFHSTRASVYSRREDVGKWTIGADFVGSWAHMGVTRFLGGLGLSRFGPELFRPLHSPPSTRLCKRRSADSKYSESLSR